MIEKLSENKDHRAHGSFVFQRRLGGVEAPSGHNRKIKKLDEAIAPHSRERGFDNRYYRGLIIDLIGKHQPVSRKEINQLLMDKLPEVLSEEQKIHKIHNLISSLKGKVIRNVSSRRSPRWVLEQLYQTIKQASTTSLHR
jgi:hypothetical protein